MKQDFRGLVLQAQGAQYLGERIITTAAEAVILQNDFTLAVRLDTPALLTIPLPLAANLPRDPGSVRLRIRDAAGNAAAFPITINGSGSLIAGNATVVINANWGGIDIEWTGTEWSLWGGGGNAAADAYAPAVPSDWSPPPTLKSEALDQLAARVTALEAASSAAQQIYTCPSGAAVRDLVYQSGSGAVDLADASDPAKMPAIGFIVSKPTATTCVIQDEDELGGFAGLTPDAVYYADPATPGGLTAAAPDPIILGEVAQRVCTAKTANVIRIEISTPPPVEP